LLFGTPGRYLLVGFGLESHEEVAMSGSVTVKAVVAQSAFDYVKEVHGLDAWDRCLARFEDSD